MMPKLKKNSGWKMCPKCKKKMQEIAAGLHFCLKCSTAIDEEGDIDDWEDEEGENS